MVTRHDIFNSLTSDERELLRAVGSRYDARSSLVLNPVRWVEDKVHEYLWSKQREIIESVRDNRYTAVPSAHDMGKSHIASRAIGHWIDSHPPGSAFVVSTAPSAAQVSAILWREIGKVHRIAQLQGRVVRSPISSWYIGNELVGYGRKPADYEQSAFQGIHAEYVLVVIDEAGGVAASLYEAIDSLATNENARVLAIGNPDDPGAHFASVCKPNSGWNVIRLDALRSPNMAASEVIGPDPDNPRYPLVDALLKAEGIEYSTEDVPPALRPMLVSALWVNERIERWCGVTKDMLDVLSTEEVGALIQRRAQGSSIFQSKVRGVFPNSTANGVIPLGWIEAAMSRWLDWDAEGGIEKFRQDGKHGITKITNEVIGVDVAYGGQDETVLAHRIGNIITALHRFRHADTTETALQTEAHLLNPKSTAVVDVIGIGAGVFDTLRRWKREGRTKARALAFNAAAQSYRTDRTGEFTFRNDRSAAWWNFRELLDPSRGSTVMLPPDERLKAELAAPDYKHLVGAVIQVESKDDIRKKLGRSTDSADAVIQTFWTNGMSMTDMHQAERNEPLTITRGNKRNSDVLDYEEEEDEFTVGRTGYTRVSESDYAVPSYSSTLG